MADTNSEEASPSKNKSIILIAVVALVMILSVAGAVVGTLFFTGVLGKKHAEGTDGGSPTQEAHSEASSGAGHSADSGQKPSSGSDKAAAKAGNAAGLPQKKPIPADAKARFEKNYMDLDEKKSLVTNISGSRKVLQVSVSLMTQYDDRVFKNVERHRAALRSAALDVLRQVQEQDLPKADFRLQLAQRLRDQVNLELERLEGFGGIEEVFFTEFVYQ
jgi:flagellar FliL protein